MKTNKVIGIVGYKVGDAFGVGLNHIEFVNQFGNPKIIMPWEKDVNCDILYLPGGMDLNPSSSNSTPSFKTGNQDVFKQHFYDELLPGYIGKVPIFGVCLGLQMLASYFGSKITQNLINHEQSRDRWEKAHDVFTAGTAQVQKKKKLEVNSHHHQCVLLSDLSKDLIPTYLAEYEDGLIFDKGNDYIVEAFRHKELPIYAVQWHPEELYDHVAMSYMKYLTSL